jgi:predicted SprT family Zn-dependent metalloprotease
VTPLQKPKSRLEVHAPKCAQCKALMKVRILIPGRKVDDVAYRCEKCREEVMRSVPRVW